MNAQQVSVGFKISDVMPQFEQSITIDVTNDSSLDLNNFKISGGDVTDWEIIGNTKIIEGSRIRDDGTIIVSKLSETISDNVIVKYSNSGGEGTFNLSLTYYFEETEISDDDSENFLPIIIIAVIALVIIFLSFLLMFRKQDDDLAKFSKEKDTTRQTIEQENRTQKFAIEQMRETAAKAIDAVSKNNSPKQDSDSLVTSKEFAAWCLEMLGKTGPRKITDEWLEIPEKIADYLKKQGDTSSIDLVIRFALNYPNSWNNDDEKKAVETATTYIYKTLKQLSLLGGAHKEVTGSYLHIDYVQTEPAIEFVSSVSEKALVKELGSIRSALWDYCEKLWQLAVFVKIGPYNKDVDLNPLPHDKQMAIKNGLQGKTFYQVNLPNESLDTESEEFKNITYDESKSY